MIKVTEVVSTRKPHYVIREGRFGIYYFCTSKKELIETTFTLLKDSFNKMDLLVIYDVKGLDVTSLASITDEYRICKVSCVNGRVFNEGKLFKQNLWLIDKIITRANELFKFSK